MSVGGVRSCHGSGKMFCAKTGWVGRATRRHLRAETRVTPLRNTDGPTLEIQNQKIEYQNVLKYLDVTLDRKLSYDSHVSRTRNKAIFGTKTMYPLHKDKNLLLTILIYKSYIRPILTYCAPVWTNKKEGSGGGAKESDKNHG